MVLLFIGPSGSGKDTQAEILAKKYGFLVVSTGEVLRSVASSSSDLALEVSSYIDKGSWVPDELMYRLLEEYLQKKNIGKLILTGAVRTVNQVPMLDKLLNRLGTKLDKVVYFELNDEEAIKRLSGRLNCPVHGGNYHMEYKRPKVMGKCDVCGADLIQREDDRQEAIARRLEQFHAESNPIINMYASRGLLLKIDAKPPIADIAEVVERELGLVV